MRKLSGHKKGVTLLEVVISLLILQIILVPVVSMVLTTVKTNKNSDDKMKALAIAQEYIEKIKSSNEMTTNSTEQKDGFAISKTLTAVNDYNFDVQDEENSSKNISYDMCITIDKNNNLLVKDRDNVVLKNIPNLSGNSGIAVKNIKGRVEFKVQNSTETISAYKLNTEEELGNVKIELIGSSENNIELNVDATNEQTSRDLNMYVVKQPDKNIKDGGSNEYPKCNVVNKSGSIKSYYNIIYNDEVDQVNGRMQTVRSRLYKVEIKVSKNSKVLQNIIAYKTFYE